MRIGIIVGDLPDAKIRIAYQPELGFAGTDTFTIHYQVRDRDVIYLVTVTN